MKYLPSLLLVAFSSLALAQDVAPDALVKSITTEVIGIIKQDKDIQAGNPKKIADVVEKRILPHLLTYSNALSLYRDQVIDFKPLRMKPDDTEVTIKSDIKQKGAQPVTLDYDMEKTPSGWKVFDVKVSGVSLITNYREDFAAQVRESGIDGLIKVLVSKNRGARPEKT